MKRRASTVSNRLEAFRITVTVEKLPAQSPDAYLLYYKLIDKIRQTRKQSPKPLFPSEERKQTC